MQVRAAHLQKFLGRSKRSKFSVQKELIHEVELNKKGENPHLFDPPAIPVRPKLPQHLWKGHSTSAEDYVEVGGSDSEGEDEEGEGGEEAGGEKAEVGEEGGGV